MNEQQPQFSVTFRDEKNNATLTVNYDTDMQFRRGVVGLSKAIGQFGLAWVIKAGQDFAKGSR
jgi:hypothetical protein